MGLRFTQLKYSLCFLFFFSLLDDGGSCCCWFWLVVASVGAELWSDSLLWFLLLLFLSFFVGPWDSCSELLRCDFVGFLGGFSWVGDGGKARKMRES